ncbi:MAG: TadE/TadG family type IV pilus assembly protein [Actinomycetota bacterium]
MARRMGRFTRHGDRGAAAVEMALVFVSLIGMVVLTAPLGVAMRERLQVERVAGQTARFATAAPDRPRSESAARRPSIEEIKAEAARAWSVVSPGSDPLSTGDVHVLVNGVEMSTGPGSARQAGQQVTVRIQVDVDLGGFGSILRVIDVLPDTTVTMTAEAVGRQE